MRYHIVSIVAVFLALALGIVVGTTALNGPITTNLRHQVDSLTSQNKTSAQQIKELQAGVDNSEKFATAYGSTIVNGSLASRNVLVVAMPGSDSTVAVNLSKEVTTAGGKVSGWIQLTSDYTDPKRASDITTFVTQVHPINLTLPTTSDAGTLGGALLSYVLLGKGTSTDVTKVLAGLADLRMLKIAGSGEVTPSTLVLVVSSGTLPAGDSGGKAELSLLSELRQTGGNVVVAGDAASATGGGLIAQLRNDTADRSNVSSVDNADTDIGQVSTILALSGAATAHYGQFGTGSGVDALFPNLSSS
jgi:Copper transport outer membrane protein, MctB